jgi:aminoglycoside phosphotransferase (APT) family kinase protein
MKKDALVRKLKDEFPDLRWKSAKHNVEGWDHHVLILDNKIVFRFPRMKEYLDILKKEVPLLRYLKSKIKLQIPDYKFVSRKKDFAGYNLIEGIQLTKKEFDKLPGLTKQTIAKQLSEFLTSLHRTPLNIAKSYGLKPTPLRKEYLQLKKDMEKLVYPRVSRKDKALIMDVVEQLRNLKFLNWVVIHNDLYPAHILMAPNKKSLTGIIDFGDICIDDPALDFCELWIYGRKFVLDVYKYYRGPKDEKFIERSILYNKRVPLCVMNATPQTEGRTAFTKGYQIFKEIYYKKD